MKRPALTVLLVEDSEDDALIVRRAFHQLELPHELVVRATGESAIKWFEDREGRAHVVLLDINLPGMSGLEVLKWLRASAVHRRTPVVVLSASGRDADVLAAYEAGANHYLVKPVEYEVFVELMRKWDDYWANAGRIPPRA